MRNIEFEDRMNANLEKSQATTPEFLSDRVDADDIMKRISENIDDQKFMRMFASFTVCINKDGEDEAVVFHCRSLETDLFVEYLLPMSADVIEDPFMVRVKSRAYRGPEAHMLEDTYRLGLYEYLNAYTIDEQLCAVLEQLCIILDSKARQQASKMFLDFFKP